MVKIGRLLATAIAISVGFLVLLDLFTTRQFSWFLVVWASIVVAFTLLLGVVNLFQVHINKIRDFQPGWVYSLILILSFGLTLIIGWRGPESTNTQAIFDYVLHPLESTFFALIALFIASAAYRAFRIKDFETFLLVAFAIIVLLGQVPVGFQLWPDFPLVKEWVLRVPTLAGIRGILLGVALGTIATGMRVLLGIDRPYADRD